MTKTTKWTVGITLSAMVAIGIAIKQPLASEVKDSYFDADKLGGLPADLAVARPTHFPHDLAKIQINKDAKGKDAGQMLGRNVLLPDVIGAAWDCNPSRVVLPSGAPKGGFDFLVTAGGDSRRRLKEAVRKDLGYVAHQETRETRVWVLKAARESTSGLAVSSVTEVAGATVKDGRLYLKHQQLGVILGGLSQGLREPVVDKTGLDGFYDFSVPWTPEVRQHMQDGAFSPEGVKKVLADMGLSLEPEIETLEMYLVEKSN